jgi:PleD family two-component response regulator
MLMQVLVAEPSAPISNALRKFLDGVAEVQVVHFLDEAVEVVRGKCPDVLIASVSGSFDGEALCTQVKKLAPELSVVLLYPPADLETAPRRAVQARANGFLVGPLKRFNVLSALLSTGQLRAVALRASALESELKNLQGQLAEKVKQLALVKPRGTGASINTADEAFFKKYMLLEVKRSKRYHYPVALLLVGLDQLDEHLGADASPEFQRAAVRAEAIKAIGELIRDIDIAMAFAGDKYLVFLPHTPRGGAQVVARRVVERLKRLSAFSGGTASVGVAFFDARQQDKPEEKDKNQVSFGKLVREASELLKKAQAAGGDRVEISPAPQAPPEEAAKPKKNRISMG